MIEELEEGREWQVFAFPIERARLDAIADALRADWERGFDTTVMLDEIVARWTPEFVVAAHAHRTAVEAWRFTALLSSLLDEIESSELRERLGREVRAACAPREGLVAVPTGAYLGARAVLRQKPADEHRAMFRRINGPVIEGLLAELSGSPRNEDPGYYWDRALDPEWLIDGRPATTEQVRRYPSGRAGDVHLLLHGEPVDASRWAFWFAPLSLVERVFHLGIGPYVASLGGSQVTLAQGRRIDDPSWHRTALTRVIDLDIRWRVITEPAAVRGLALDPTFHASRARLEEIAANRDAVCCRIRHAQ